MYDKLLILFFLPSYTLRTIFAVIAYYIYLIVKLFEPIFPYYSFKSVLNSFVGKSFSSISVIFSILTWLFLILSLKEI